MAVITSPVSMPACAPGLPGKTVITCNPWPKEFEYEPSTIEDFRASRVFCGFKIDPTTHAIEDFSETAKNVLSDETGEITFVRRICTEAPDEAWNGNIADVHGVDPRKVGWW
jgi:hypothetical protein